MLALTLALALAAATPQASLESPCGIPRSRQLIALDVYSDRASHTVQVDPALALEFSRPEHGPVVIRRVPQGDVLYEMPESAFDGMLTPTSTRRAPNERPLTVRTERGTLYIDPSSTLEKMGAWVFVCWMPKDRADPDAERHRELYSDIETDAATGEIFIRRTDGSTIPLPALRNQVEIEKTYVSADGKRIGWLVDEPNCCTSYPVPLHLVIFKGGRIEKTFEEDQCIFDWAFAKKGAAVSYWMSVLHGSDYQNFLLRDIASGKRLARYFYPDSFDGGDEGGEARREAAIAAAPRWVKDTPSH